MTARAPWSVKGIDPKARAIAKDRARRSGMTLGEWLNHIISGDHGDSARRVAPEPEPESGPGPNDDLGPVLSALQTLSERLEASEREQAERAARFEAALAALGADQAGMARRLDAAEQGGGAEQTQALRALEETLRRTAVPAPAGEGHNGEAIAVLSETMDEALRRMDGRIAEAEARSAAETTLLAQALDQRLRRAEEARSETLVKLGAQIARLAERLSDRIGAVECRQGEGEVPADAASELVDRTRQSEARTLRLLEEARETIERREAQHGVPDEALLAGAASEAAPAALVPEPVPIMFPDTGRPKPRHGGRGRGMWVITFAAAGCLVLALAVAGALHPEVLSRLAGTAPPPVAPARPVAVKPAPPAPAPAPVVPSTAGALATPPADFVPPPAQERPPT
jgi:localization factor PodJL